MKVQNKKQKYGTLEKEAYYLIHLKGIGIPKIISYGFSGKYNILIEELLGKSLEQLFKENSNKPKRIRLKDMIMAGIQIIERLEFIHSKYIIHLDIKPNNFLVGKSNSSLIYIIDFGFAKKYRSSKTGKHIKYSINNHFSGNLKFSTANTMKGIEPSRRDDLESLGYMLIYLFNQELPWDNIKAKNKFLLSQKIFELKNLVSTKLLCKGLPKEMEEYMKYVKSLKFEENPNYYYLNKIMGNMLRKINEINDLNFSWTNDNILRKDINYISSSVHKRIITFVKKYNSNFKAKSEFLSDIKDIKDISKSYDSKRYTPKKEQNNFIHKDNFFNKIKNTSKNNRLKKIINNQENKYNFTKEESSEYKIKQHKLQKKIIIKNNNILNDKNAMSCNNINYQKLNQKLVTINNSISYNYFIKPNIFDQTINSNNLEKIKINDNKNINSVNYFNTLKPKTYYLPHKTRTRINTLNYYKNRDNRSKINNINQTILNTNTIYKRKFKNKILYLFDNH